MISIILLVSLTRVPSHFDSTTTLPVMTNTDNIKRHEVSSQLDSIRGQKHQSYPHHKKKHRHKRKP